MTSKNDENFYSAKNLPTDDDFKNMSDDITTFLAKIHNKYSNNAEQKHLNQMYNIGILVANKNFNREKLTRIIEKIIQKRSHDPIKKIKEQKRKSLIEAFKKGINDAISEEYMMAYDSSNKYQYDKEKLKKRAELDYLLDTFKT